jgi:hypothetical protein
MPKPPEYGASTLGGGYNLQRELMKKHQQRELMKQLSSTAVQTIIICICMMHNAAPDCQGRSGGRRCLKFNWERRIYM